MIKDDALQNRLNANKKQSEKTIVETPPVLDKQISEQETHESLNDAPHVIKLELLYNFLNIFFPCVQMFCYGYAVKVLFMPDISRLGYLAVGIAIYSLLSKLLSLFHKN
jgi:hypothetical protein